MGRITWTSPRPSEPRRACVRRARLFIDLRGHGPALQAASQLRHTSVAALVRAVLADWLASNATDDASRDRAGGAAGCAIQEDRPQAKVTLRMPAVDATRLAADARAAELSQGLYVALLVNGRAPLAATPDFSESRSALMQSTATLAALAGDLRALMRFVGPTSLRGSADLVAVATQLSAVVDRHLMTAAPLMHALAAYRRLPVGKLN